MTTRQQQRRRDHPPQICMLSLEIRAGNVETGFGARRVFGAVAKAGKDIEMLSRRTLDAVGRTKDTALTAFTDGYPALRRVLADRLETRHGLVRFNFMIPALWPTTNRTRNGILCGRVQNGTMNKMADSSRTAVGCPASRRRHMRGGEQNTPYHLPRARHAYT